MISSGDLVLLTARTRGWVKQCLTIMESLCLRAQDSRVWRMLCKAVLTGPIPFMVYK